MDRIALSNPNNVVLLRRYIDMKFKLIKRFNELRWSDKPEKAMWKDINSTLTNYHDLVASVDWFIMNLRPNHSFPGSEWQQLIGISEWCREHQTMTLKQAQYITIMISSHWDEVNHVQELQFI
jgi:hypothetical protein